MKHTPNLLHHASAPTTQVSEKVPAPTHKKPRRRYGRWIAVVVFLFLLVITVPAAIAGTQAFVAAQSAKSSLNRVKTDVERMDIASAKINMTRAQTSLGEARDALQGVGFWRDVPGIGLHIRALEDAAAAGAQTLDGLNDALNVVEVVTDALRGGALLEGTLENDIVPTRTFEELSIEEKRDLLSRFANALPDLRLSRDKVDLALELWNRVPQNSLMSPLKSALKPVAEALPKLKQALDEGVPMLEALVPLAGYPNKVRYLVLLQNADEIRPGGGFIGTVGTVTLDAGDMPELNFEDVYAIDNPASYAWKEVPPQPIVERLGVKNWYLRDANWSPDFPTSAARILDFYTRERELGLGRPEPNPPTAVIALEPALFRALLHLTGPLTVEGKQFTEENFFDQIQYEVEEGFLKQGIPLNQRKDLVGKIGDELVAKLKGLPASRWGEIVDVVSRALEQKQIMVFSKDPSVLKILDDRGWTARTKPTRGDFAWVIDANLAALKTDGMMVKRAAYAVDVRDPAHPTATMTLTYTNTTKKIDWRYTRYRSYTRLYVPEGAQLIKVDGAMKDDRYKTGGVAVPGRVDVTKELGKTVFGAFWSIEPNQTGVLRFTYELPQSAVAGLADGKYTFDWPKQAGVDDSQLTLNLLFGKTIQSAAPAEARDKWGDARYEYRTDSLQDRTFEIKLQ